ncbi:diacylglycerol kinase family protein [Actinokineospora sp. UTMC 2448]|uniref:diacylglycerol/lipid kinase family protein n=1 Tax=Actinokineospora sp. UTMC 2448 TaxID=2268449 RepID=UPI00216461F6|nr:diacylglycerol kinase family protein [Actinokineospora sp. UTMC 2448]UVS81714.1 Diacylglycerol kinase [Actinokineospora sp. UTMC 2448]
MRAVLVVNPQATATSPAGRDVLAHALASQVKLDVVETDYRGHALIAAAQARTDGVDLVVAHGGDGTVNEVVNGLLQDGPGGPMLGVVPGGSANVFARALGLPRDPVEATHRLLTALEEGRGRDVGLGRVETEAGGRWFTFNAGMGWDADVVADVDRKRGKRTGPGLYARTALARYLKGEHHRLTVEFPGDEPIEDLRLVFVSNTDPWTYLGPRPVRLNPAATFDDGLGVFALRRLGMGTVLRHATQALSASGVRSGRHLVRRDDVDTLLVSAQEPVKLQCDGDLIGEFSTVRFRGVEKAVTVVV